MRSTLDSRVEGYYLEIVRARVLVVGSGALAGALALAACSYDWTYYGTGSIDAGGGDATLDAEGGGPAFDGGTTQDVAPPPTFAEHVDRVLG